MQKKRENLFQVACLRLFEGTHKNGIAENVGNHPNAYFTSSRQYTKDTQKKSAIGADANKTTSGATHIPAESSKPKV